MNRLMYEKSTGYVFLALVFVMMCVLRLWFTLYLVFAIALVLTTLHKKRSYCRHMCPIALAQDAAYQKKDRFRTFDAGTMRRVSTGFVLVFWALLLGLSLYHLYEKTPMTLWFRILLLMWGSLAGSLVLQEIYGKRIWCKTFCPLSRLLDLSLRKLK